MRTDRSAALAALPRRILAVCVTMMLAAGDAVVASDGSPGLPRAGRAPPGSSGDMQPASPAPGQLVLVTNCNDAGAGSLRAATGLGNLASIVDLHQLTCSKITLTSGPIVVYMSHVTLVGPGRDVLTIDGNGSSLVLDADNLDVVNLTIANGSNAEGSGGCIRTLHDLNLISSTITGCRAGDGSNATAEGGGAHVGGYLTMSSSRISQNEAIALDDARGGGARADLRAYLYDSTIDGNRARAEQGNARGGGLSIAALTLISDSLLSANAVESGSGIAYGGAIANEHMAGLGVIVNRSTVSGNAAHSDTASAYGGGIHANEMSLWSSRLSDNTVSSDCDGCTVQGGGVHTDAYVGIAGSLVSGNRAQLLSGSAGSARGGGVAMRGGYEDAVIAVSNSTLSGNSAIAGSDGGSGLGGGFSTVRGNLFYRVSNSTIAFNCASSSGGGFVIGAFHDLHTSIQSTIVAMNEAPEGADIGSSTRLQVSGSHNLIRVASNGVALPPDTMPFDPKLLPLADNGGPTPTHALAECSPARDFGSNPNNYPYDQRGAPYLRVYNVEADIGAFELQPDPDRVFGNGFDPSLCL